MDILALVTTRAASVLRATALAAAGLIASGCAVFSPVQTEYDYPPADGVDLSMDGLELRGLAIVGAGADGPGVVIGQAVNSSASAVDVSFSVEGASAPAEVTVPAGSGDALSEVPIESIPGAPGDNVQLVVSTPEAGQNVVTVPVLAPVGYYEELATPTG